MHSTRYEYFAGKRDSISSDIIEALYIDRKKYFVDKLGWTLDVYENKELDQYDHENTEYIIVTDNGEISTSLRLYKTNIESSLMQQINSKRFKKNEDIWELSRLYSNNFSFSSAEYILFYVAFKRMIEINVNKIHTTMSRSDLRKFQMLGVMPALVSELPCEIDAFDNYSIGTDVASFERYFRRMPPRDVMILRQLQKNRAGGHATATGSEHGKPSMQYYP